MDRPQEARKSENFSWSFSIFKKLVFFLFKNTIIYGFIYFSHKSFNYLQSILQRLPSPNQKWKIYGKNLKYP